MKLSLPLRALTTAFVLAFGTHAFAAQVADSFNRPDNAALGATEAGAHKWVEVNEKDPAAVSIKGGALRINYLSGNSKVAAAALDGYQTADVEIRVRAHGYYNEPDRWHVISYRLPSPLNGFDGPGYHVRLSSNELRLTFGTRTITAKKADLPVGQPREVRVVAVGKSHKVYLDGTLQIDATDETKLDAGHVGLAQYYQIATFDDFIAGKPGTLKAVVKKAAAAAAAKKPTSAPAKPPQEPAPAPKPEAVEKITIRYASLRHAFLRGEDAAIKLKILTPPDQAVERAVLDVNIGGVFRHEFTIDRVEPGGSMSCLLRIPTRVLKAGSYDLNCRLYPSAQTTIQLFASARFPLWIAHRPNPDRMPVWLWPHSKFGIHVKKLDDMCRKQFAWYADIGVNAFQPNGYVPAEKFPVFDYALVNGWTLGVGISGAVNDKFEGLPPEAKYEARRKHILNDAFHPAVARLQNEKNRGIMEIARQFPNVRMSFFNTEIIDVMVDVPTPMSKHHSERDVGPTVPHGFILPGVIPDSDERYVRHLHNFKIGDGLALANERAARVVHRYTPDHLLFTDPHRVGAVYDKFRGLDLISTWTYTNPDPKYMLFIESLIAAAKPERQGVMHTVSLLNYPDTIFPKDKGWTLMGPARLLETSWINLSRRPDALSIYLSSECDPIDTAEAKDTKIWWQENQRVPYQRDPDVYTAFKEFTTRVVQPYGPMIKKLKRSPRRAAVLSSESSRLYPSSPGWAPYYDNYAVYDFYILLNMIHVPADVIYDETVLRYGLDDYDVLFLPRCETLIKTVYDKIVAFRRRGGLVVSDQHLRAPISGVVKFDFDFTPRTKVSAGAILKGKGYAHWDDLIDVEKMKTVEVKGVTAEDDQKLMEHYAAQLRKGLAGKVTRTVECSSPTALTNMLESGRAKYLFVINDKRTYGPRVGQYKAMLDKAVPQTVTLTLNEWPHPELYVYDMIEKKPLRASKRDAAHTFDVDLTLLGGKIIALLPAKPARIEIRAPGTIRTRGVAHAIAVTLADRRGVPLPGACPLKLGITDPNGNASEYSDYYAAESGTLALDFTPALNDTPGRWTIEVEDLISGLKRKAAFKLAK